MAWTTPKTWSVGAQVPAADLNTHVRDNLNALAPDGATSASWTPALSGASSGGTDPADTGREYRIGPIQFAWAYWLSPSIIDPLLIGAVQLSLPSTPSGITSGVGGQVIGSWRYYDSSNPTITTESGVVILQGTAVARFARSVGNVVTDTTPFVAGTNDTFSVHLCYPVA